MIYTDIREVKRILEIEPDNHNEDTRLWFFIEQATKLIEEFVDRPGLTYAARTEYYDGTGTQKLLLTSRPVFLSPAIRVFVDQGGFWGSVSGSFQPASTNNGVTTQNTELIYGTDFALKTKDGVSSRNGILVRLQAYWPKPFVRAPGLLAPFRGEGFGNIKVVYTAGYTVETLPAQFRLAANTLVAKLRYLFPLGMELGSESYEGRSIGMITQQRDYLLSLIKPMLFGFRNWHW